MSLVLLCMVQWYLTSDGSIVARHYRVDTSDVVGTVELATITHVGVVRKALVEVTLVVFILTRMSHVELETARSVMVQHVVVHV